MIAPHEQRAFNLPAPTIAAQEQPALGDGMVLITNAEGATSAGMKNVWTPIMWKPGVNPDLALIFNNTTRGVPADLHFPYGFDVEAP